MPKRIYLYPYNSFSESCKNLDYTRIRRKNSRYRHRPNHLVIQWGNGNCPYPCLNQNAGNAVNKLNAFRMMQAAGVSIPEFSTNSSVLHEWKTTVIRYKLSSSEGNGIKIYHKEDGGADGLLPAPLYVKYIKKSKEFRVHVFKGNAIDVQQKVLKKGIDPTGVNFGVRNTANGFIFQRSGIVVPDSVKSEAIKAVAALGLDFGGVDVIWNEHHQRAYVLEVNTAPGIEGTTVERYREAFNEYANRN